MYGCFSLTDALERLNAESKYEPIAAEASTIERFEHRIFARIYTTSKGMSALVIDVKDPKEYPYPDKIIIGPLLRFQRPVYYTEFKSFVDFVQRLSKEEITYRLSTYVAIVLGKGPQLYAHSLTRYGCFSLEYAKYETIIDECDKRLIEMGTKSGIADANVYKTRDGKDVLVTAVSYYGDCEEYKYTDKIVIGPVGEFVRSVSINELTKFVHSVLGMDTAQITERLKNYKPVE